MTTLDINMYFGLSIILCYFLIFYNNPDIIFQVSMNSSCFRQLRSNYNIKYLEQQLNFLIAMCNYHKLKNVKLKQNSNTLHPRDINNWPFVKKNDMILPKNLIPYCKTGYKNYIIINTKVSQQFFENNDLKNLWDNEIKHKLFSVIKSLNLNVMLTGERSLSKCKEYNIHRYFEIYNDLIELIEKDKIIDLTSENTEDLYSIDKIVKNLNLIKNSLFCISIGGGGQNTIYSLLNDTLIFAKREPLDNFLDFTNHKKNFLYTRTTDMEEFIGSVKKYYKRKIRIVQASHPHTGSTVLVNLLHGVLCHEEPTYWDTFIQLKDHLISKTHVMDFDKIQQTFPQYDIYFVVSERENHLKCDEKYKTSKNVLIVDYEDIQTKTNSIEQVANFILPVFKKFLPEEVFPNLSDKQLVQNTIKRLNDMDDFYEKIKNKSFDYFDDFYGLHGSHKNRNDYWGKIE